MLKHIHPILSPELVKTMMEMGHGDEIVFADRNFPAASLAKRLLRYDAIPVSPLLEVVLEYFPLDHAVPHPVALMRIPPEANYPNTMQDAYRTMLCRHTGADVGIELHDRQHFYTRAAQAFAIVVTGESARFANIILRKGVFFE